MPGALAIGYFPAGARPSLAHLQECAASAVAANYLPAQVSPTGG